MSASKPTPRRRTGCAGIFFALMMVMGAGWGAALGGFLWLLEDANATIEALEEFRPKVGSKVYSDDGELLGEFSIEKRRLLQLSEIPLPVQKAFVATEDDKFFSHLGVRPDAIVNAALYTIRTGTARGGSTITQQVVRNVDDLMVGTERTIDRKLREALRSLQVEQAFTKDEILELYLNKIFLGISAYGVEAASWQYFGKSVREVTLSEAAMLAGLTRSPNKQEPIHNFENALTRRNIVLGQMLDNGFISQEEHDAALLEDLAASVVTPEERLAKAQAGEGIWAQSKFKAPYFVEEVRQFIYDNYGRDDVLEKGLRIETTLDMRLQRAAEEALLPALDQFDELKLNWLTKVGKEEEFTPVSGAIVCLDNRRGQEGFVRALVGGRDFDTYKFNNATQALRQPGSSVKPFIWAAAVDNGMTASTVVVDEPFVRVAPNGKTWSPKNFTGEFLGPITLRHALEKSVNIVSIKLVEQLGVPLVSSYLERSGIQTDVQGLTIALGTPEVTVLQLAAAYSTFPNGGIRHEPVIVKSIASRDGIQVYDYRDYARSEEALDADVAYVMTHMLQGVCTPDYKKKYYPTATATAKLGRPRGGKTGTTNESRNVWFCGFTPYYTTVVWLGYTDNRPLGKGRDHLGRSFTGGGLAAPVWTEFMIKAHEGLPEADFEKPFGVDMYNIDRLRGTIGGDYEEAYLTRGPKPPVEWYGDIYAELQRLEQEEMELLGDIEEETPAVQEEPGTRPFPRIRRFFGADG